MDDNTDNDQIGSTSANVSKQENITSDDYFWSRFDIDNQNSSASNSSAKFHEKSSNYKLGAESATTEAWLIGMLLFGCLLTATVIVMVCKRCYDSWQKRHYQKVDYLVNGMYN